MRQSESGFSTIEVLFAVALIGLCLVAALQVQIGTNRNSEHVRLKLEEARATRNALAIMREFNPAETPSGVAYLPQGDVVAWRATRKSPWIRSIGFTTDDGEFEVALYTNTIEASGHRRSGATQFTIEQIGWRR